MYSSSWYILEINSLSSFKSLKHFHVYHQSVTYVYDILHQTKFLNVVRSINDFPS